MMSPEATWLCVTLLVALAGRSVAHLALARGAGRAPAACSADSRAGDLAHAAMALGMAAMVLPTAIPALAFELYFGAMSAFSAGGWTRRVLRRRLALRRGEPPPCAPAHALEPHHLVVGLAMVAMAAGMSASAGGSGASVMAGMAGMPGMGAGPSASGPLALALDAASLYVWIAAAVLGAGLMRVMAAGPVVPVLRAEGPGADGLRAVGMSVGRMGANGARVGGVEGPGAVAGVLGAPAVAYGCEIAMTVVMGVMLLG
jgi:hypothetical protein